MLTKRQHQYFLWRGNYNDINITFLSAIVFFLYIYDMYILFYFIKYPLFLSVQK